MRSPRWTEPVRWAREEASRALHRGLSVPPTFVLFEGEEPTVYVRPTRHVATDDSDPLLQATEFASRMGARRVLTVHDARLSDPDETDPDIRNATAESAVSVEWRADDGDEPTRGHALLRYRIDDDGGVCWGNDEMTDDGGLLRQFLDRIVADDDGALAQMGTADLCYAMSRQGIVVGVHPRWRTHYGLDRAPGPRGTRPVDRQRALRLRADLRAARTEQVDA